MAARGPYYLPEHDPSEDLWLRIGESERGIIAPNLAGPPVAIGRIANLLGIEVLSSALPSDISGQIRLRPDDDVYEIKINISDPPVRQRFTVAHEIGHFLLHRSEIDGDGITDTILFRSKLSDRKETEANKIAAMLLLPWTPVIEWAESVHNSNVGPALLQDIAAAWKVSALTAGYRFGF
jgi:IrrE N-terminal-like domain